MAAGEARRKNAVRSRIARLKRHLNLGVLARAAVAPAWLSATAFVSWRVFVHRAVPPAGVLCALAAAAAAGWLFRRRAFTDAQAAVVADRCAGAQGLLLTRLELPVGAWEFDLNQKVKVLPLPPLEVGRPLVALAGALAFVALGLFVPVASRPLPVNVAAAGRVEALAEKLAVVAREVPSEPANTEELDRLRAELAQGTFDGPDWEAADALDGALDRQAAEAGAELAKAERAAERLADAMATAQGTEALSREKEELERALLELSQAQATSGDDALKAGPEPESSSEPSARSASGPKGQPSAAEVDRLRRALAERRRALSDGLGEADPGARHASGTSSAGRGASAAAGHGASSGRSAGAHASRAVTEGAPGRGGEAGTLVFGAPAEMDPSRLKIERSPKGRGGEGDELYGLRAKDPRVSASAHASPAQGSAPLGEQAPGYDDGALLPRNRALIRRYFDSEESSLGRHRVRAAQSTGSPGSP